MDTLRQDLRYALRLLARSPAFTVVAVITLGLGIGANTAIFSVVNRVLLRPLPFHDPDRLVRIAEHNRSKGWEWFAVSPANFVDWQAQSRSFERMAIANGASFTLLAGDEPERIAGLEVTADFFALLGVQPALGRTFRAEEDEPASEPVAVLTHGLWQRRFGADPALVGRTVPLQGVPHTVVGVMPAGFRFTSAEIFVPMALTPEELGRRGSHWVFAVARLAPGVSLRQARAEMDTIAAGLAQQHPDTNGGWGIRVEDMHEQAVGDTRPALLMLGGAVGFVLLIACANVAHLLLARATGRRRELAVRVALGAARPRLVRQMLTEGLVLALGGAALGLIVAAWGMDLLSRVAGASLPGMRGAPIDGRVLGFTLGASLTAVLLFGLVPALVASRAAGGPALREGGRGASGSPGRSKVRSGLVVAELALALVLLIGAGLLMKSLGRLAAVPPGFDVEPLLTASLVLPESKYPDAPRQAAFVRQVLARLSTLPGVERAAAATVVPLVGRDQIYSFEIEGRPADSPAAEPSANYYAVSADYFRTLGIPLRRGRFFDDRDAESGAPVAIVDETFARRYFPGQDIVGQRLIIGNRGDVVREIVGVVGAVTHYALEAGTTTAMYEPYLQQPQDEMTLVLRARDDPGSLAAGMRQAVLEVDREQPLFQVRSMEEVVSTSLTTRRLPALLLGIFAALALALAAVGLYGVVSYAVTQRTHEVGVRMALGAARADVLRLVVGQAMGLALVGAGIGLVAAAFVTRAASRLLFGVSPTDPVVFLVLPVLLIGVALVASYLPARRATRVDPLAALRCE